MESFQKKHPLNKVAIGVIMNESRGSYRPVWTGDVEGATIECLCLVMKAIQSSIQGQEWSRMLTLKYGT